MEKFNQVDNVHLGHRYPRSFENTESSRQRTSDTDFNDVFGGPPRRFSMQEIKMRYSFGETGLDSEDDNAVFSTSLNEKPVFGEESDNRKRYVTNDFFDDIFKGDESYSSPRRSDRDPMCSVSGSTPGSRVLSPDRPFPPPEAEIFGSSPPPQFSSPAKMTTTMDSNLNRDGISDENSNSQSSKASFSKFLSRSSSGKKETRNYRQSPLSREVSLSGEESPLDSIKDKGGKSKEDTGYVESPVDGSQFHFSIYKWPGAGVPLMASLRVGKSSKSKNERTSCSNGSVEGNNLDNARTEYVNTESVSRNSEPKSPEVGKKKNDDANREVLESKISDDMKNPGVVGKATTTFNLSSDGVAEEPEMKTPRSIISENVDAKGNSNKEKKNDAKRKTKNKESPGSPMKKNTPGKSGVKGKVTEFVKIFNQESTRKSKIDVDTRNQSSRWKNSDNYEGTTNKHKMNEKVESSKVDNTSKVDETRNEDRVKQPSNIKVDETPPNKEKVKKPSNVKTSDHISDQKSASSFHASSHETSKATSENSDDHFHEGFTVEEISQDQEKVSQTSGDPEEIRASDAKIQQWSNGRKGNIRSLLSTLQLVLWPESGWKPVPLVNIIEGSAVKRAYQRALLCLHPDKLQQKDASFIQKYIAEKVFDILQEAWDQYNTLGAI